MTQIPLQSRFKQDFYRVRYPVGAYVNGRYTVSSPTVAAYKGSIQPAVGRGSEVMTSMREGQRTKKIIIVYTYPDTLRTADERTGTKADLVYFNNEMFEVQKVNRWTGQILTHDEVWAVESDASIPNLYQARVELDDNNEVVNATSSQHTVGVVESVDSNQIVDVQATVALVGNGALEDSNQDINATGDAVAAVTITPVGSGLTITNNSFPRLAVLTSSLFAYHDSASDQLRAYSANTGTGSVALSGSGLSLSATQSAIVGMGTDWIATHIHTGSVGSLRRHNWGGSSWTQASTTSNSNLDPTIIKVNSTTVVVRGGQDEGTYHWSGSNFSRLTSNVPGSGASNRFGCYLDDNKIALFSPTTGGYNLETWALSGTTWSKVGNTLFVAITSGLSQSSVTSLSTTRIVTYWGGASGGRVIRVYDFNGTDWSQIGTDTQVGSATALNGAVAALGSSHFVHIDDVLDKLQIYSVT